MAASFAIVSGTLPQANSGTVSLTDSGFGTATAAIIIMTSANTTNNPQGGSDVGISFWDGTNIQSVGASAEDNQGTSDTYRHSSTSSVVYGPTSPLTYTCTSITDGIQLEKTAGTTGVDRYVTVLLIKGTTNTHAGNVTLGTGTSAVDITAPAFQPDFVFLSTIGASSTSQSGAAHSILTLGAAHNSTTGINQGCVFQFSENGVGSADTGTRSSHSNVTGQFFNNSLSWQASISDFDANGFSLTPSASAGNDYVFYLALEFTNQDDAWLDVIDAATSTGNDAHTGLGFSPDVVGFFSANNTSLDSNATGQSSMFSFSDGTNDTVYFTFDEDAAGTSNTESERSTSTAIQLQNDVGTADAVATVGSLDADGFTLNYSDAAAGATKIVAFAFGDSSAGGGATVGLTGVSSTSAIGNVDYTKSASIAVTGNATTSGVGSVSVSSTITVSISGNEITTNIGNVGFSKSGSTAITGNASAAAIGSVSVSAAGSVSITGNEATGAVGTVTTSLPNSVSLSGVSSVTAIESIAFTKSGQLSITGNQITGNAGSVSVLIPGLHTFAPPQRTVFTDSEKREVFTLSENRTVHTKSDIRVTYD